MPFIEHQQYIKAPIDVCFDLARNVNIHTLTASKTKESVVGGVMEGHLELGDTVTWEAIHFGIKLRLTAQVTIMDRPYKFQDVMVKGAFHSFTHTHEFRECKGGTLMIDLFEYKSPLGYIGDLADLLFLQKYMKAFIANRANELKKIAEIMV